MSGNNPSLDVYLGTQFIAKIDIMNERLLWTYSANWRKVGYAVSPYLPLTEKIPSTCGLSRALVARRLRYLIGKIKNSLHNNIKFIIADKKEKHFLNNYAEIIIKRSEHLLEQSNYISSINL